MKKKDKKKQQSIHSSAMIYMFGTVRCVPLAYMQAVCMYCASICLAALLFVYSYALCSAVACVYLHTESIKENIKNIKGRAVYLGWWWCCCAYNRRDFVISILG